MPGIGIRLRWHNPLEGGPPAADSFLLLEDGFFLLLETGDKLVL